MTALKLPTPREQRLAAIRVRMAEINVAEQFRQGVSADRLAPLVGASAPTLLRYLRAAGVHRQRWQR